MNFSLEAVVSAFALLFLAEVGDKTQLLLLALATRYRSAWHVFLGAWFAEIIVDGVAIYFGAALTRLVPLSVVKAGGGLLFVVWAFTPCTGLSRTVPGANPGPLRPATPSWPPLAPSSSASSETNPS